LTYAYDKPGIYEVKMEVQAIDSVNFNTKNYGLAKNVVVLTQEDYDADKKLLAMERAKQAAIPTEIASEYETLKKERDFLLAQGAKPENKRLNELNARLKVLDNKIDDLAAKTKVEDKLAAAKSFGLGTVYFSFDKFYLHPTNVDVLENNLKVLKENKEIDVTLLGHTDNRATHEYNMILSRNRAKSVYEYLVKNGIDKKRLQYKGVATTQPENRCGVGVECDEVEHAINRRVEFFVDGKKMEDKKLNGPTIVRKLDGSESYSKYGSNSGENNKALPQSGSQSTSNTSEVSLEQATIAKSVQGLSPVDEGLAFNNADGSVFCYTNVISPEGYVGHVTHVWKLEGKQMAKVKLKVRGPRWRTYSSKFMNDEMIGNWTVEVLNDKNELMKEFSFTVK